MLLPQFSSGYVGYLELYTRISIFKLDFLFLELLLKGYNQNMKPNPIQDIVFHAKSSDHPELSIVSSVMFVLRNLIIIVHGLGSVLVRII